VFAFCGRSGGLATIGSAVGAGTSVRPHLPRASAEEGTARPAPAVAQTSGGAAPARLHVLLVEDNAEVAAGAVTQAVACWRTHAA